MYAWVMIILAALRLPSASLMPPMTDAPMPNIRPMPGADEKERRHNVDCREGIAAHSVANKHAVADIEC